jgi:hypothetical protein
MDMALYTRADGLLEPRNDRGVDLVRKQKPGTLWIGRFVDNVRSDLQNRYLNGWVYKQTCEMLNDAGYTIRGFHFTRNRLHAMCQVQFLVVEEIPLGDGTISYIFESTAQMSRKRFCKYIDGQFKPWILNDYGISIPEPDDDYYRELHREIYGRQGRAA